MPILAADVPPVGHAAHRHPRARPHRLDDQRFHRLAAKMKPSSLNEITALVAASDASVVRSGGLERRSR
jgi:hypothetical protein